MRVRYFILFISVSMVFGQYRDIPEVVTKVATSAANWLKLETSARAIGMGGTFVASGRGVAGGAGNTIPSGFFGEKGGGVFGGG